ncbi:unnamed protein product [Brugia timori]|uniref:Large ribosomal subunit protein mL40 n=1 Tax=Brugia timori TaxID=42155 RepID=A0A0R3QUE2_9BILA|nr:unnamed protein product [Brugia timori]
MLSPELYKAALEPDECFLQNFVYRGPTLTPPIESYEPPDGHYIDQIILFCKLCCKLSSKNFFSY